jgi:hypothetical protein
VAYNRLSAERQPAIHGTTPLPAIGSIVKDNVSHEIGQVMAYDGDDKACPSSVTLRPPEGGCDWEADPRELTVLPGWQKAEPAAAGDRSPDVRFEASRAVRRG